jgi:hypothetical protein
VAKYRATVVSSRLESTNVAATLRIIEHPQPVKSVKMRVDCCGGNRAAFTPASAAMLPVAWVPPCKSDASETSPLEYTGFCSIAQRTSTDPPPHAARGCAYRQVFRK